MRSLIIISFSFVFLSACGTTSQSTKKLSTPSSYSTDSWVTTLSKDAKKTVAKKDTGIVFLHGKRGNPDLSHNSEFISKMADLGYTVIAPLMPWSEKRDYMGSREQGMEVVTAAVNALDTKKVVVVGHSMGGMGVLQYGARGVPSKVVGLISVAPGHDPNNAYKLLELTRDDASRACELLAAGKGKERSNFPEMNAGKPYMIYASAEYYCTHYSVNEYPDSQKISRKIKTPLFILSGKDDRLTDVYSHGRIYTSLPENSKNKHAVLSGGHLDVLYKHTDVLSQWIDAQ